MVEMDLRTNTPNSALSESQERDFTNMAGHRTENRISFWGYFGFGRPLLGLFLAVFIIALLIIVGWPIPAAFFVLVSLGFLYGIYKSCQMTGREGVNVPGPRLRSRQPAGDRDPFDGNNQMFLELAANALVRDHRGTTGSFPPQSSMNRASPPPDDPPPDYYEVTGISKSVGFSSGEGGCNPSSELSTRPPSRAGDLGSDVVSRDDGCDILASGNPHLVLFRLPSYDEAVANGQRSGGHFSTESADIE
ncbi:uncharacterized protein LOC135212103 [Macrobrachium nipponense]|uniref:uncharacterized protein LOC135212103 n=1 Tax=Macrobrachium nipponense TaxID=159736 RepID=UPI0030C7DEC9